MPFSNTPNSDIITILSYFKAAAKIVMKERKLSTNYEKLPKYGAQIVPVCYRKGTYMLTS
jgi:hypothetical protein